MDHPAEPHPPLGMCVSAQTFHPSSAITRQLPFENYVSTSGIGPATFFLSRLVILQRGRRSCYLSVRGRSIYQAIGLSGAIYVFRSVLGKPGTCCRKMKEEKCRS